MMYCGNLDSVKVKKTSLGYLISDYIAGFKMFYSFVPPHFGSPSLVDTVARGLAAAFLELF